PAGFGRLAAQCHRGKPPRASGRDWPNGCEATQGPGGGPFLKVLGEGRDPVRPLMPEEASGAGDDRQTRAVVGTTIQPAEPGDQDGPGLPAPGVTDDARHVGLSPPGQGSAAPCGERPASGPARFTVARGRRCPPAGLNVLSPGPTGRLYHRTAGLGCWRTRI